MSKKLGRDREGLSDKGEGVRRKGIACHQSQTFYRTLLTNKWKAIVEFDWLVACQSKSDINHLTFMHNRHLEYKTRNKIKNMAKSMGAP